jgi:hypothetical protein
MSQGGGPGGGSSQDLRNEFEKFKSEVGKIINELRKDIEDLKNSIVELRASLSEVENPFNLLATLASGEEGKKPTEVTRKEEVGKPPPSPPPPLQQLSSKVMEVGFNTSLALIKWVWTLLDLGFDEEDVKKLSNYCEFFSLLPRGSSQFISEMASAVSKARALNLSEDIVALSIYGAAKASGVKVELEDITDIVFNALRKFITRNEVTYPKGGNKGDHELNNYQ